MWQTMAKGVSKMTIDELRGRIDQHRKDYPWSWGSSEDEQATVKEAHDELAKIVQDLLGLVAKQ